MCMFPGRAKNHRFRLCAAQCMLNSIYLELLCLNRSVIKRDLNHWNISSKLAWWSFHGLWNRIFLTWVLIQRQSIDGEGAQGCRDIRVLIKDLGSTSCCVTGVPSDAALKVIGHCYAPVWVTLRSWLCGEILTESELPQRLTFSAFCWPGSLHMDACSWAWAVSSPPHQLSSCFLNT